MSKYAGSVFDADTPNIVRVSRIAGATVLSLCAMLFCGVVFM